ncbi:hypothetical protein [Helcococcus kunzii]|uniref:hypothetical protein n=2 Tax=Helcococcus kunzii TaxID=40091 RepID=UPI0021A2BFAA|nr:hypothetical protein [Helcococcus kunzii]MCT1796859.1 hypothetical protein [Helcococcus kunzii]
MCVIKNCNERQKLLIKIFFTIAILSEILLFLYSLVYKKRFEVSSLSIVFMWFSLAYLISSEIYYKKKLKEKKKIHNNFFKIIGYSLLFIILFEVINLTCKYILSIFKIEYTITIYTFITISLTILILIISHFREGYYIKELNDRSK